MNSVATAEGVHASELPLWLLKAVAAAFALPKIAIALLMAPLGDEAYYWVWGQHVQLSYFDHPPLLAWLLGLFSAVFGATPLGLRVLSLLTALGSVLVFRAIAKRVAGADWERAFWLAVAIYLASPTFGLFITLAYQDQLLVFLCLASAYFFLRFFAAFDPEAPAGWSTLYMGALLMGLAGLTKYNALFLGLGLGLTIVFDRRLRALLRAPHLYFAALLVLAMQAPVFWWNLTEGFASYRFHLSDRHGAGWLREPNLPAFGDFLLASIGLVGPMLVLVVWRFFTSRPEGAFERLGHVWGRFTFVLSGLTICTVALFSPALWYWNIVAYVLVLPFAFRYMREVWPFAAHVAFGAVVTVYLAFSYLVIPVPVLLGGQDAGSSSVYGWQEVSAAVAEARAIHGAGFIATTRFRTAGQLGFALGTGGVTELSPAHSQFDYWFDATEHTGESAIILADDLAGIDHVSAQFGEVALLNEITVARFGRALHHYQVYIGRDFRPSE